MEIDRPVPSTNSSSVLPGWDQETWENSWTAMRVFILITVILITIATILGNTLVFVSFCKYAILRTPSNSIILSLAVVDVLLSAVFIMNVINLVELPHGKGSCAFTSALSDVLQTVMVIHLCLISFDRFLAVKNSLTFYSLVTMRRVLFAISLTWFLGIFISVGLPRITVATHPKGHEYSRIRKALHPCDATARIGEMIPVLNYYALISVISIFLMPLVFMLGCYAYILRVARRHRLHILAQHAAQGRRQRIKTEMKGAVTAALVVGIFVVCFTPLAVVAMCRVTNPRKYNTRDWARVTQGLYLLANSSAYLNPLVYAWRTVAFRKAFGKILCMTRNDVIELSKRRNSNS